MMFVNKDRAGAYLGILLNAPEYKTKLSLKHAHN